MAEMTWHIHPDITLRKAGFAFDLLERLYCPLTTEAVAALLLLEREREQLREEMLCWGQASWTEHANDHLAPASKQYLGRLWKSVKQRRIAPYPAPHDLPDTLRSMIARWEQLLSRWNEVYAKCCAKFDIELRAARDNLRVIVQDPTIQEAIFLNSPHMYRQGVQSYLADGHLAPSKRRAIEKTLLLYLQRLCAKNDTASFFGPMNYGRFQPTELENLAFATTDTVIPPHRRVLLSYWAAEALASTIERDERLLPESKPLRSALVALQDRSLMVPGLGREYPLDPVSLIILKSADGGTSLRTLSEAAGVPLMEVIDCARHLQQLELVKLGLPLAPHPVDPLAAVESLVRDFGTSEAKHDWAAILLRFREAITQFERAGLSDRVRLLAQLEDLFTTVVGLPSQRFSGQLYSDRLLLFEETSGDVTSFVVGAHLYEDLSKGLQTSLDLIASCAVAQCRWKQWQGREQLETMARSTTNLLALLLRRVCSWGRDTMVRTTMAPLVASRMGVPP